MGAEIATILKYMWNGFATALPYALGGASMAAQIQAGEYAADAADAEAEAIAAAARYNALEAKLEAVAKAGESLGAQHARQLRRLEAKLAGEDRERVALTAGKRAISSQFVGQQAKGGLQVSGSPLQALVENVAEYRVTAHQFAWSGRRTAALENQRAKVALYVGKMKGRAAKAAAYAGAASYGTQLLTQGGGLPTFSLPGSSSTSRGPSSGPVGGFGIPGPGGSVIT